MPASAALAGTNPVELALRLRTAAVLDDRVVDRQLDTVGAEPVGEGDREVSRHCHRGEAEVPDDLGHDLALGIGVREPPLAQLAHSEREEVEDLGVRQQPRDPGVLELAGEANWTPVDLHPEQRVDDRDRDLVAERGGTLGVAEQHQRGHGGGSSHVVATRVCAEWGAMSADGLHSGRGEDAGRRSAGEAVGHSPRV